MSPFLFEDVTDQAGLAGVYHEQDERFATTVERTSGGVAVADVNLDDYPDFFVITGHGKGGELWINQRDGTFRLASNNGGVEAPPGGSGPLFFYFDDDSFPDLFIGSVSGAPPVLYRNLGDGNFALAEGLGWERYAGLNTTGATAVDFDRDGREDLFLCRWKEPFTPFHFFRNTEGNIFEPYDVKLNFNNLFPLQQDHGFTANFRDLNGNGFPDLLLSGDFGTTQLWYNEGGHTFSPAGTEVFTDRNGMGGAVGDYDNDGDEDWFVTAIYDDDGVLEGNWEGDGNRLYQNDGQGVFSSVDPGPDALATGWGWGTSFADFDHDGWLDLIVTNGWPRGEDSFKGDTTRLFSSAGSGRFVTVADFPLDTLQGRGIGLLDIELDGDMDILIANNNGPVKLLKNQLDNQGWIRVLPLTGGRVAHGALVVAYTSGGVYQRAVGESSNYLSQNESVAHFGIPTGDVVDSLKIHWPGRTPSLYYQIDTGQSYVISSREERVQQDLPILKAYPNPVVGGASLTVVSECPASNKAMICSVDGRLMGTATLYERTGNTATYLLPASEILPTGKYYFIFISPTGNSCLSSIKIMIK